jgi:hypothetical protein
MKRKYKNKQMLNDIACGICKIKSTEHFCDLCKTNQKIQEEREAAHKVKNKPLKKFYRYLIIYYIYITF